LLLTDIIEKLSVRETRELCGIGHEDAVPGADAIPPTASAATPAAAIQNRLPMVFLPDILDFFYCTPACRWHRGSAQITGAIRAC
jgi:hypothetical protein